MKSKFVKIQTLVKSKILLVKTCVFTTSRLKYGEVAAPCKQSINFLYYNTSKNAQARSICRHFCDLFQVRSRTLSAVETPVSVLRQAKPLRILYNFHRQFVNKYAAFLRLSYGKATKLFDILFLTV